MHDSRMKCRKKKTPGLLMLWIKDQANHNTDQENFSSNTVNKPTPLSTPFFKNFILLRTRFENYI